ncbi:MAG: ABC transporter ATP-binding protein [Saprospiraceae bacterium]|nr:ABC transporter ATP-binding protein [Saprospiraceae bacterium]
MSLRIELVEVAKRYRLEWVLRHINLTFEAGRRYALTGPNGSGKSTLMKMLSGHLSPSRGKIRFQLGEQPLDRGEVYRYLSYAAPYVDLIEEFTLQEAVDFHCRFKNFPPPLDPEALIQLLGFKRARQKPVRAFSSGMKQRLKLALAICSDTPMLLLDEPTTNLDQQGVQWYLDLIHQYGAKRTIVVASNAAVDYGFCEEGVDVMGYKK